MRSVLPQARMCHPAGVAVLWFEDLEIGAEQRSR
jgi:hypothetical protein